MSLMKLFQVFGVSLGLESQNGGQVGLTTKGQGAVCYKNLGDSTVCNVQSLYFICISEFH